MIDSKEGLRKFFQDPVNPGPAGAEVSRETDNPEFTDLIDFEDIEWLEFGRRTGVTQMVKKDETIILHYPREYHAYIVLGGFSDDPAYLDKKVNFLRIMDGEKYEDYDLNESVIVGSESAVAIVRPLSAGLREGSRLLDPIYSGVILSKDHAPQKFNNNVSKAKEADLPLVQAANKAKRKAG